MSEDLPFSAEYAKSGRAVCKTCGGTIPKDQLRVAKMVQSPHFDGKVPMWNHFHCFFRKNKVKSTGDIKGFGTLRYEDQKKLTEKVGGLASTGKSEAVSVDVDVQYAKSNRSTCRGCFMSIDKDTVRVGCWVDAEGKELAWAVNGKKQAWHHPACFVDCRDDLDIDKDITADMINGYKSLKKEDQQELVALLGKGGMKKMKRKMKENIAPVSSTSRSFEKKLQAQSNYLYEIRKSLKNVQNKYLREMLEENGYPTHGADIKLIDRCCDGIAFGRFCEPCPICEGTYFSIGDSHYICRGDVSEFTKCTNTIAEPKRGKWKIPDSVKEQSDFLANLKLKTGTRLFNIAAPSTVETDSKTHTKPLQDYVFYSNVEFIEVDGEEKSVKEVIEKIGGGKVYKKFTAKCNAVLTDNVDSGDKTLKRAIALETPVVQCEKLVKGIVNKSISDISSVCFSGYEGDDYVKKRRTMKEMKSAAKRERSSGSDHKVAKKAKVTVQNGAEVFSETGLSGRKDVEVYKDLAGTVYACTLGQVDVSRGTNSYYKLQILKRGTYKYELFRAWGRIGTDIGGTKFDEFRSPNGAIDLFNFHYTEKTGNVWGEPFVKHPSKFHRMDLDYGAADVEESSIKPGSLSKLDKTLQSLVKLIFDINMMKQALVEFEIDLNKMPLGKLSKNQIKEAFKVLSAAQEFLEDAEANKIMILDATNKFFTLIPHDFGMSIPPLLNNVDLISSKTKMLETLLELEIAYNMTKTEKSSKLDPIDLHYRKLNSDISVIDHQSEEFELLQNYVNTTHAKTHTLYTLDIINIFKVNRHGEEEKFKSFSTFHNRQLLWHGSRISNFAGILSQGLRIAPPEAPVTGYMFGKGVYFADMVSKSANYCCTTPANNTGLLLLCEVALGDMYELTEAKYIERLPKGKHSTKGIGRTAVQNSHVLPNGCIVPLGPGVETDTNTTLLYNEYIVYNTDQVNVKYVFQMRFNYGKRQR